MTELEEFVLLFSKNQKKEKFAIGSMISDRTCRIGDLEYDEDDLLISSHLKYNLCTKVNVDLEHRDISVYVPAIKKGDLVLVYLMNNEKIVILEKIEVL